MSQAEWCIFAVFILPYLIVFFAKAFAPGFSNKRPRASMESQGGWRKRAYWAHSNTLEALPAFAVAILICQYHEVEQLNIDFFAKSFVAFRFAYVMLYINNSHVWRSLAWLGGFLCIVSLFLSAAKLITL